MTTKTQEQELTELRHEVAILRSFVIGVAGKDAEGEYNPEFVRYILEASQEETAGTFTDSESFLAAIQ
jgi:hypothetical protein